MAATTALGPVEACPERPSRLAAAMTDESAPATPTDAAAAPLPDEPQGRPGVVRRLIIVLVLFGLLGVGLAMVYRTDWWTTQRLKLEVAKIDHPEWSERVELYTGLSEELGVGRMAIAVDVRSIGQVFHDGLVHYNGEMERLGYSETQILPPSTAQTVLHEVPGAPTVAWPDDDGHLVIVHITTVADLR